MSSLKWNVQTRLCMACGKYHGPVNDEINCLRATVTDLRARLAVSEASRTRLDGPPGDAR